jgi:hypothetical protein
MIRIVGRMKAKEEDLSAKSDRKNKTEKKRTKGRSKLLEKRNTKEFFCYVLYLCNVSERNNIDRI